MTILLSEFLNSLLTKILRTATSASPSFSHTKTPLPAARPSTLTTTFFEDERTYSIALFGSEKIEKGAVRIPVLRIKSFANTLLDSNRDAFLLGPKIGSRPLSNKSTIPNERGADY